MIDRLRHALGIKSAVDIRKEINGEAPVRKAIKALRRAAELMGEATDDLEDYQAAEDDRLKETGG